MNVIQCPKHKETPTCPYRDWSNKVGCGESPCQMATDIEDKESKPLHDYGKCLHGISIMEDCKKCGRDYKKFT